MIYLKMKDRQLTEKFLSLAVKDTFVPVLHRHLYEVPCSCIHIMCRRLTGLFR